VKGTTILTRARRAWPGRLTVPGRALRRLRLIALCLGMAFTFAAVELGVTTPAAVAAPGAVAAPAAVAAPGAAAASYAPITGAGSTWAYPAIHAWIENLVQYGISITYTPNGSTSGRTAFSGGQADWAASEIPYDVVDGNISDPPPNRGYVYVPDVAGGTTLMYNLQINGQQVTNLRLSEKTVADIFTNKITNWDNSEIAADNPGLTLPNLPITPVVRSDGAGSTYDFTAWMQATEPADWSAYCAVVGRTPCTPTSTYPVQQGTAMQAQSGDSGVATYVANASSNGAIGYTEYAWALEEGFPVAKLLNAAGYYTLPSPGHVAVSLLDDQINTDASDPATYLTQNLSGVYTDTDPRTYELSAYSYFILPTDLSDGMTDDKGYTIGAFGDYALCLGQSQVDVLGYSALPINLAEAGFAQLTQVPGAQIPTNQTAQIAQCDNPTFSTNGTNTLADDDPQPLACDKEGPTQCAAGVAEPTEANVSTNVTNGNGSGSTTPASSTSTTGTTSSGATVPAATTTAGTSTSGATTSGTSTSGASTSGATSTSSAAASKSSTSGATASSSAKGATSGSTGTTGSTGTGTSDTGTNGNSEVGSSSTGNSEVGSSSTGNSEVGSSLTGNSEVGSGSNSVGSSQAANDNPVTLPSSNGSGLEVSLMAVAAAMMFGLSVVPPLLAQAGRRSRRRRGIDEFFDDGRRPGDRR
jgi:ABC-type phosphate transport system substrate-binding protein